MTEAIYALSEMLDSNLALRHFFRLQFELSTLAEKEEAVQKWIQEAKLDLSNPPWIEHWQQITIQIFPQVWPTTDGGWGGIGKKRKTEVYTTVIHNPRCHIMAVYWADKFAYALVDNIPATQMLAMFDMPGINSLKSYDLQVIYQTNKYE